MRKLDTSRMSGKAEALSLKFANAVVGQPKAVEALIGALEKYQSGIYNKQKPIASLLFLGPTGTGKTLVAEELVAGLCVDTTKLMKIDCAEFQHSHEIAKLLGSPPGYLGHRETHPFFTNKAVREKMIPVNLSGSGFTIILFDEIEKSSDSLWDLLLAILDKGTLTTGTNEVVDLTKTIIVMTSNVGAKELSEMVGEGAIGFFAHTDVPKESEMETVAMAAARRKFKPEFLNRFDKIVMFNTLTEGNIEQIMKLEFQKLQNRIILDSATVFDLSVSPAAYREILREGFDRRYNARELNRTIERRVSVPLGRLLSTGQIMPNDTVVVDFFGDWKFYAGPASQGFIPSSVRSGRLEMPKVSESAGATPAPCDLSKPSGPSRDVESFNDVREMSSSYSRRLTDSRGNHYYRPRP